MAGENNGQPSADEVLAIELVDNYTDLYEQNLLCCLISIPEFFYEYYDHLVADVQDKTGARVFTQPLTNDMFHIVANYYLLNQEVQNIPPCYWEWVQAHMQVDIDRNDKMVTEMSNCLLRWNAVLSLQPNTALVIGGLSHFLRQTRAKRLMQTHGQKNTKLQLTIGELERVEEISTINIQSNTKSMLAGMRDPNVVDDRDGCLPGPLPSLNYAQGGGLAKKEVMGVVAPENAGKTVVATQFGTHWARLKSNTLFLSTEQGVDELFPRCVSNECGIDFGILKNGVTPSMMSQEQLMQMVEIDNHLKFIECDDGYDIAAQLLSEITRCRKEGFDVENIILDWIGGGLGEMTRNDADRLRFIYQMTANKFCAVCKEQDLRGIFFAQAAPGQAEGKSRITGGMVSECKTMFQKCTWGIGLSAIPEIPDANNMTSRVDQTWADEQWITPFKVRKSKGGMFKVRRNYKYQRLEDFNTGTSKQANNGGQDMSGLKAGGTT